jgi:hypothetical protein
MEASLVLKELLNENERSRLHLKSLRKLSAQMNSQFRRREEES